MSAVSGRFQLEYWDDETRTSRVEYFDTAEERNIRASALARDGGRW